ncbi:MAG TPA: hypothetical protein VMU27_00170 [Candidatus Paceibacterota bacterium]|nr:hypothetical protein [Candidatus Paceibacterota bacterium]
MEYLYHRVPTNMAGTILYPLNILKELHPEIYSEHVKKYEGREQLLTTEVPPLHCLWNDVLHFTAVVPSTLKANLVKADIELPSMTWFKVPVTLIQGENSIAFTYRRDVDVVPNFKEYEPFDPARMEIYRTVPDETLEYYKRKKTENVRPLLFHLVPHILYKGTLETKGLEVVYS